MNDISFSLNTKSTLSSRSEADNIPRNISVDINPAKLAFRHSIDSLENIRSQSHIRINSEVPRLTNTTKNNSPTCPGNNIGIL